MKKVWIWIAGTAVVVVGGFFLSIPHLLTRRCVVEGELVSTPSGERRIEELKAGDAILCESGPGTVVATCAGTATSYLELEIGGRALRVTAAHPIATERGWVEAGALSVGDALRTRSGVAPITAIRTREASVRVFDLEVEPSPSFFASGVLVHNKSSPQRNAATLLKHLASAQARLRANDYDKNMICDFWVRDVAGLRSFSDADGPLLSAHEAESDGTLPSPKPYYGGYLFRSLAYYYDAAGQRQPYDTGGGWNVEKFGFVAWPVEGRPFVLIINQDSAVWQKQLKTAIDTFPKDPAAEGWSRLD